MAGFLDALTWLAFPMAGSVALVTIVLSIIEYTDRIDDY